MDYDTIKKKCLDEGSLFEDTEFPACNASVYYSKQDRRIQWKRPNEISKSPKFVVDRASRFDLDQGAIGNCWYIAAAATLATRPELFKKVIPDGQTFTENYAGIFRFKFWRFGKIIEVIVDDRLPTYPGLQGPKLIFCRNREEPNEFWSALLEKAYAKVHGSWEALEGGWTEDALVDFTGGIGERIDIKDKEKVPKDLFRTLLKLYNMSSLMGCSITSTKETMEHELDNGLVIGHAYSITKINMVKSIGQTYRLMRLRNPWGKKEWTGAWSDGSKEWKSLDSEARKKLGLILDEDGEFWMCYEDWVSNYQQLQICHLPPGNKLEDKEVWNHKNHHGSWVKGLSAGGCGNPPHKNLYWSNPQYRFKLDAADKDDEEGKCTAIVSLMQKYSRLKRTIEKVDSSSVAMSYDLYKLKSDDAKPLNGESYQKKAMQLERKGGQYGYYREVSHQHHLEPGTYVVIPSMFTANDEADFLLRIYTEQEVFSEEMDEPTGPIREPVRKKNVLSDLFRRYAGSDGVVDARELRLILNEGFAEELGEKHEFDLEACRSLLAMMDEDKSGVLELNELHKMWIELTTWRGVFKQFDKDGSGYVDVTELRTIFRAIGYNLSRPVLSSIVRRYGGKESQLAFNDFIMVITKVVVMMDIFAKQSTGGLEGKANLTLDEFLEIVLYF